MKTKTDLSFPIDVKKGSTVLRIYKTSDRGRDRYLVPYYEGSRRIVRGFASLDDARKEAALAAERLNDGQQAALELNGKDRDAYLHAMAKLKPLGITLATAVDEYCDAKAIGVPLRAAAELYHRINCESMPVRTVAEAVDELLTAKQADGVSALYLRSLRGCLVRFAGDFNTPISNVTTQDIDLWLRSLQVSPRSRNNFRTCIITLFRFCKRVGYLRKDADTAADATSLAKKQDLEIEVFTPSEMASLLKHGGEAVPFLVLGGFCGLRTAEINRLKWEDVNWAEKVVNIKSSVAKTRTRRLPPLNEAALAWLEPFKGRKGLIIRADVQRLAMRNMLKNSRVEWKKNALRHGFGTYRMAVLKDPVRVAYEMGNSPAIIRQHYDRVVTEAEGIKWFSVLPNHEGLGKT